MPFGIYLEQLLESFQALEVISRDWKYQHIFKSSDKSVSAKLYLLSGSLYAENIEIDDRCTLLLISMVLGHQEFYGKI